MEGVLFCEVVLIFFLASKVISYQICQCVYHDEVIISCELCGFFLLRQMDHEAFIISLLLSLYVIVVAISF